MLLRHELEQFPLRGDRTFECQPAVLGLTRLVHLERIAKPLVRCPRTDEFGRAERVPKKEGERVGVSQSVAANRTDKHDKKKTQRT